MIRPPLGLSILIIAGIAFAVFVPSISAADYSECRHPGCGITYESLTYALLGVGTIVLSPDFATLRLFFLGIGVLLYAAIVVDLLVLHHRHRSRS